MNPVLKRIVLNGLLSALVLGLIGMAYVELASYWLASVSGRPAAGAARPATEPVIGILKFRAPTMMALLGFLFVVIGESVLHLWRGRRSAGVKPARELKPDTAEVLLNDIFFQVESLRSDPNAESIPPPKLDTLRTSAAAPSPSTRPAENSPTPELVPAERGA